jgi:MYXO-CTERM domain-containing protein
MVPMSRWVCLLALILAAPLSSAANDWPQFRYNEIHTGAVPSSLNSVFGTFTTEWWTGVPAIAGPPGSPSIRDNIVYVGDAQGRLWALDQESGGLIWSNITASGAKILGAPAVGQDFVHVLTDTGQIYSFTRKTGTLQGTAISAGATFGSVLLHEDILYAGSSSGVVTSFFASTRQQRWSFSASGSGPTFYNVTCAAGGSIDGTPVVFEDQVFFGSTNHCFFAVKKSSFGSITQPNWVFKANEAIRSTPAIDPVNRRVIFGDVSGRVYAVPVGASGAVGSAAWTWTEPAGSLTTEVKASPAIADGKVVIAARNGNVRALDSNNGQSVWEKTFAEFVSSPAIANGKVLVGSLDRKMYMLNLADGNKLQEKLATAEIESSPAISGTQGVWTAKDGTLYSWGGAKPQRADLAVLGLAAPTLTRGVPATVTATVQNVGQLAAPASVIHLYVGTQLILEASVPALEPGASHPFSGSVTAAGGGTIELRLFVDPLREIQESNESNNVATFTATVIEPPSTSENSGGDSTEEPGIPGPGLLLALIGFAAVAWARRRRDG